MEIGLLIKSKLNDETRLFRGNLKTIQHNIRDFVLCRNPLKNEDKPKQPDYIVYLDIQGEPLLKIGAAWHRHYERGGVSGEMISLTFDDPSFDAPLHVTAFRGDDEFRWPITWRRRQTTAA